MITKTPNPNDALDLFEIEMRARAMRAEASRNMARAISAWISARVAKLGQRTPTLAKG